MADPLVAAIASMVTSKPAISGHFKTGQWRAFETELF